MTHVAEANDSRLATDGAVEVTAHSVREAQALVKEASALIDALLDMPSPVDEKRYRVHKKAWGRWKRRLNNLWELNDRRNDNHV